MSSRQTGSRYMNNGSAGRKGYEGGVAQVKNPGLMANLFGQSKMSGGLSTGTDGKLGFTPYQGSSGIFGGQSRINAQLLNSQLGAQVLQQQHEKELSTQEEKQQEEMEKLKNGLTEHLNKSTQINAIATKLGIPVDQLTDSIAHELATNAFQDTKNTGAALQNPDVQKSYNTQLIAGNEAQGAKNASLRAQTVTSGGASVMPGLIASAQPTVAYGATPRQTTVPDIRNFNGKDMLMGQKVTQDYAPARVNMPVNPALFDAAKQIQPDQGDNQSGMQPNSPAVDLYNRFKSDPTLQQSGEGGSFDFSDPNKDSGGSMLDIIKGLTSGTNAPSAEDLASFYQRLMGQMAGVSN